MTGTSGPTICPNVVILFLILRNRKKISFSFLENKKDFFQVKNKCVPCRAMQNKFSE
jgi:hypothetical protein